MTWRKLNYGTAENERGVRVTRTGFKSLKYERDGQELRLDVEPGDKDLGVYARSITKWLPSGEIVPSEERARIITDIEGALTTLSVPFTILWN
jgi:hypothetical protein